MEARPWVSTGFDDAVARSRLYLDAGADAIFPEALESAAEFAAFAKAIDAPLLANMTEFGKGPLLVLRAEYPAMGDFATAYIVRFKRPATALDQLRLRMSGERGGVEERVGRFAMCDGRDRAHVSLSS